MLNKNNIVSKSKQLLESKFPDWDAATLNVFDTYLSRINPGDPESAEVKFTKKEYEDLLGISEMRPEQLNKCISKLLRNTVSIELKDKNEKCSGWANYCLFDRAKFEKNENGEWEVNLRCHPDLQQLFFDLRESGYQKFRLKYALSLKNKTSKLLYYLLKDNQYRVTWTIELSELRERLGATAKMYETFKDFNKFVLKRALEEINDKTDIEFTYEKIKKGRLTRAIKFSIKDKPVLKRENLPEGVIDLDEPTPGKIRFNEITKINIEKWRKTIPDDTPHEEILVMENYAAACEYEFCWQELQVICSNIPEKVQYRPSQILPGEFNPQLSKYDYLQEKFKILNTKPNVKNRYAYFVEIVKKDWSR